MSAGTIAGDAGADGTTAQPIAGVWALKGLVLYGATLTFAALYSYFIVTISLARPGAPPRYDAALVSTAAALAGILGSAFALSVGTKRTPRPTSGDDETRHRAPILTRLAHLVADEPARSDLPSWPKTVGIWVYAVIASAVAITYVLNQSETPATIKALAVAFGGYVLALVTAEYKAAGE